MSMLEELLLPGTPASVRDDYLTLAQRAQETTFGLLEEDLVMLDTETTGLSFRKNELIEIAAARISGREVVERFQTFVHPTGPIPAEITALTGIRDLDVMDAPSAVDAVAALAEFVGGMPVVAHNALFDRTFVEGVEGGDEVSDVWIDSLALSRIALPRLSSHSLANMAEAFGCASVTHRATDDVDALCGMWRIFLVALTDLPHGLVDQLANMHPEVEWPYRPILSHVAKEGFGATFSFRDARRKVVSQATEAMRSDFAECSGSVSRIFDHEIEDAFGPNGVVAHMYSSFEQRDEQVLMAREVAAALGDSTHRAIEAGTGVGKSMAYLLPEIVFAKRNGITVGVATKTNALTDQLVSHELPALAAELDGGVSYTSIKGYDHYPCLRRLELAMVRELPHVGTGRDGNDGYDDSQDILNAIAVVSTYACQSPEGDLDALGIRWRMVPRDLIATSPAECLRMRCPYYPHECFVHGARRRAACSDIVVTNHSMLLRDIALDNAILPPIRHWVVDEAHSFEQEARRQWAIQLSPDDATNVFMQLGGLKTGVLHRLLTKSTELDSSALVARLLTKATSSAQRASMRMTDLFEVIHELNVLASRQGGYDNVTLWIDDKVRSSEVWDSIQTQAALALSSLEEMTKDLGEVQEALVQEVPAMASELGDSARRITEMRDALRTILIEPSDEYVYAADLYRSQRRRGMERLYAERYDVGGELANRWYPEASSVIYTSATIAIGESFDHFDHAVGFDHLSSDQHTDIQLDSSFDYDGHMSIVVAKDMPEPNRPHYLEALEELLYDTHVGMGGSVLTLFTNRREMESVYRNLQPRLAAHGIRLLCQERGSSPRRLRERFVEKESSSLFALKSFWEGFDAIGDTLRCVVIPKLPFSSPNDPLVRERDAREQRAWWRYSLPEAVLSVKQAAGRLIRSSNDTGVIILADSRVVSKRYGKTVINSMPSSNCIMLDRNNVRRYLDMWCKSH